MNPEPRSPDIRGRRVLIAGGGIFGTRTAEQCVKEGSRVILVDPDQMCRGRGLCSRECGEFDKVSPGEATFLHGNGVDVVMGMKGENTPYILAPCIPGHMAFLLVENALREHGFTPVPDHAALLRIVSGLEPDIVQGMGEGMITTSYMPEGGVCPMDCDQSSLECPFTGRVEEGPMYDLLQDACSGTADLCGIMISIPLGEGTGGFVYERLHDFILEATKTGTGSVLAVGTASRCHGILNVFRI